MKERGFSAKVAILLVALVVVLFSLSVLFGAYEQTSGELGDRAGPGAFSSSALGYAGLFDLLQRLGWQVTRGEPPEDFAADGILVFAEPATSGALALKLDKASRNVLVVLPKWKGTASSTRSKWVMEVESLPRSHIEDILAVVLSGTTITAEPWPQNWPENAIGVAPSGNGLVHLVQSKALRPLVATEEGMLLSECRLADKTVWILSDPDVMANHGIGDGENAAFVLALLKRFHGNNDAGQIAFDETLHGFKRRSVAPLRLLFEFPFVIVTATAFFSALLLAWSGARRFGRPDKAEDAVGFGKEQLIDNSARLMDYAGHQHEVLRRYAFQTIQSVAEALHAPRNLEDEALAAWLDRVGAARGVKISCADIMRQTRSAVKNEADLSLLLLCAEQAHSWRCAVLGSACSFHSD